MLTGNSGGNTLNGGAGADTMQGGAGNDICVIGRGCGAELLQENDATAGNTDVMQFLSGVASDPIQFKTSDGKTLLDSKVQDLVSAMASFALPAVGQTTLPSNYQATLLPIIAADWGP